MVKPKNLYHHGDLRLALLKAAIELAGEKGDTSFGLRDLAAKVGVSHPALYRHFRDRAALFNAIAAEGFAMYGETQQRVLADAPNDPETRLVQLGCNHFSFALDHPVHFRIMFGARVSEQKTHDNSLQVVARPTFELIAQVASELNGKAPMELALSLWASVHGLSLLCLDGQLANFGYGSREVVTGLVNKSVTDMIAGYKLQNKDS